MNEPICFDESITLNERVDLQIRMIWAVPAFRRQRYQALLPIPLAAWLLLPSVQDAFRHPFNGLPIIGAVLLATGLVFWLSRGLERMWYRKRINDSRSGEWPVNSRWTISEHQIELVSNDGSRSMFRHAQLQSVRCVGEHLVFQWNGRYTAQAHRSRFSAEGLAHMRLAAPANIPWPDDAT